MLDSILTTSQGTLSLYELALCTATSLALGLVVALIYMFRNTYSKNFVVTLILLPALVQSVISLVNGNLGAGVAVVGAFGLVRFRSAPGSAKEIACIFFAMAIGLATGMGYLAYAALFTAVIGGVMLLLSALNFAEGGELEKSLKVTIPEDLDYTGIFDDLFGRYARSARLDRVKTTNLGSLYELHYRVVLRNKAAEKPLIDELRCRNGNLTIVCGRYMPNREEL